jgi:hypothetical protein
VEGNWRLNQEALQSVRRDGGSLNDQRNLSHHEALKFDRRSSPTQIVLQPPVTASNLLLSALLSNLILIAIKHAQQGGNDLEQRI